MAVSRKTAPIKKLPVKREGKSLVKKETKQKEVHTLEPPVKKAAKPRETKAEMNEKKELAKLLFLRNNISREELSFRIGVSRNTINAWVTEGKWEDLRTSLLTTKDELLRLLYEQLRNLNTAVMEGTGYPDSKQANTQKMITASIHDLETETNIGQVIQVAKEFTTWIAEDDFELMKTLIPLFDGFIKQRMKRN